MKQEIKYSVVVPVFNGSEFIKELFSRTKTVFEKLNSPFEMIFVNDYSSDKSWYIINNLKKEFPEIVKGIKLSKNFGQQNATMCGFFQCTGDYVITIDDDLEMQPEDITLLIQKQNECGAMLVYGTNSRIEKISLRWFFTSAYKKISKIEGGNKGKGSSFRLMAKNLVANVMQNSENFVFIDEICLWYTENIAFVPVQKSKINRKKSRYTMRGLFRLAGGQIIFSSTFPLKFMTYAGIVIAFFNFLFGIRFVYQKIVHDVPLGYTSIIVTLLFSTGIILICLGIIGEYLGRVLRAANKVPTFSIEEKI